MTTQSRAELLATIIDESERLNRFIANLLDMTRLESGAVAPNAALHDLGEIVGSALRRAEQDPGADIASRSTSRRPADAEARSRAVRAGAVQSAGQRREVCAAGDHASPSRAGATTAPCALQVLDEGDGIPADDLERIFDKFYRAQKGDQVRAGTGLGLAISRGFVEAMHGTIAAANRTDRTGAVFTISLPIPTSSSATGSAA